MNIEQMARKKLENIIQREGDAGGERLKPYYLAQLIKELKQQKIFSDGCIKKNHKGIA